MIVLTDYFKNYYLNKKKTLNKFKKTIMKDKWMNIGFEEDELKPYNEPLPDLNDQMRIGKCLREFLFNYYYYYYYNNNNIYYYYYY